MKAKDLRGAVALHSKYLELLNNYELLKDSVDYSESRVEDEALPSLMEDISNLKEELSELGVEV